MKIRGWAALACLFAGCGSDGRVQPPADFSQLPDLWQPPPDLVGSNTLDPDAACASTSETATVQFLPVDIIWAVDNSSSMASAIDQVTAGLNDFATLIDGKKLDYRIIMLSLRSKTNPVMVGGSNRWAVCVPQPLAGDDQCGNGPRFFQSSIDMRSTQPLEQILGTLGQTNGYAMGQTRGGEPWRDQLRDQATKTIVIVTDDNSRLSATDFEQFAGGVNPYLNSTSLPPGLLDPSWMGLFDHYLFDGIYGWGSVNDPSVMCKYLDGSYPASPGFTYSVLVGKTGGVRAQICDGANAWMPFFQSVAQAVAQTSKFSCALDLPAPPEGMLDPDKVNVAISAMGGDTTLARVTDGAACGQAGGWYYDDPLMPTQVILCPASCDLAQMKVAGQGGSIEVRFGCQTIIM